MLPKRTIHATLPASDLDRAKGFYVDTLGFTVAREDPDGVFFDAADGTFFAIYPSSFAGQNPGTAAVFLVSDIASEVEDLKARGVVFEEYDLPGLKTEKGIADFGRWRGAWFKDTEGNILAVVQQMA